MLIWVSIQCYLNLPAIQRYAPICRRSTLYKFNMLPLTVSTLTPPVWLCSTIELPSFRRHVIRGWGCAKFLKFWLRFTELFILFAKSLRDPQPCRIALHFDPRLLSRPMRTLSPKYLEVLWKFAIDRISEKLMKTWVKLTMHIYASNLFLQRRRIQLTPIAPSIRLSNIMDPQSPHVFHLVKHTVPRIMCHHTRLQAQHRLISHSHPSHFVVLQVLHKTAQNRLSAHRHADIRNWLWENRLLIIIVICVSFWTACNKLEKNGNVLGHFLDVGCCDEVLV